MDLKTTFGLRGVPEEKILQWAATNRLTRWLDSVEIRRLSSVEVKERFSDLVIECNECCGSHAPTISAEETAFVDDLLRLMREEASVEKGLQCLINYTRPRKEGGR